MSAIDEQVRIELLSSIKYKRYFETLLESISCEAFFQFILFILIELLLKYYKYYYYYTFSLMYFVA